MFDRMNNHHGLNNLIWVYSVNWDNEDSSWYPGKNEVDIVGMDNYPGSYKYDCQSGSYTFLHGLVGGSKLIGMTEHGPIPDMESCYNQGYKWAFFIGWADLTGS